MHQELPTLNSTDHTIKCNLPIPSPAAGIEIIYCKKDHRTINMVSG